MNEPSQDLLQKLEEIAQQLCDVADVLTHRVEEIRKEAGADERPLSPGAD